MSFGSTLRELRTAQKLSLRDLAGKLRVDHSYLSRLEKSLVPPSERIVRELSRLFGVSGEELKLSAGKLPKDVAQIFYDHPREAAFLLREKFAVYNTFTGFESENGNGRTEKKLTPVFETERGKLYQCDCLDLLPTIPDDSVDCVFADPPFNLRKHYGVKVNDDLAEPQYLQWSYQWLQELSRVLRPGGSLFVYNLPKWNIFYAELL